MADVETIKVQAVEGKTVTDPDTMQVLGTEPVIVQKNSYWLRRVGDGSVKMVEDKPTKNSRQAGSQE